MHVQKGDKRTPWHRADHVTTKLANHELAAILNRSNPPVDLPFIFNVLGDVTCYLSKKLCGTSLDLDWTHYKNLCNFSNFIVLGDKLGP